MKIVDYILFELERQGKSVAEFERKAGISNGYLKNTKERGSDISKKILDKIKANAPEEWNSLKDPPEIDDPFPLTDDEKKAIEAEELAKKGDVVQAILKVTEGYNGLIKANYEAVSANKVIAESNQTLVNTNAALVNRLLSLDTSGAILPSLPKKEKVLKRRHFEEIPDKKENDSAKSRRQQKDTLKS